MEENLKQQPTEVVKIAFYGPESTGKTTLAQQLAAEFKTLWVPEFARDYLQKKWDATQQICQPEDLLPIAIGQIKEENEALANANQYLFCDTNLLVTKVFSEMYYGFCDPIIATAAQNHNYDLVFLTDVDFPWEKDDLRDKPENRQDTLATFELALKENNQPYIKLSGNKKERLEKAIQIINDLQKAKSLGFTSTDFMDIYHRKSNLDTLEYQFQIVRNGLPKINLDRPAVINDGIMSITNEEAIYHANYFDEKKKNLKLKKFVPASGAATRMFKFLNEFFNDYKPNKETINAYINRKKDKNLYIFLVAKEMFAFYDAVLETAKTLVSDFDTASKDAKDYAFIKAMLSPKYFDFANKPKGVLPFHKYDNYIATAIEEHLNECVSYATSNDKSNLHFTVSEEHQSNFETIVNEIKSKFETQNNSSICVKYSYQDKATDVIALDLEGNPFRDENNQLVFRPGGHGALIENLNNLHADIVFIKNIDNVIQNQVEVVALYKKALAGILIQIQEEVFNYL
ncbi:DUF4301 family protein, partial [Flavobacterium sp.]|uniref:DUF4301 family protein n=1 Tax=Flavobacterium sp. TaxID=239 RepID=UPI0037BE7037